MAAAALAVAMIGACGDEDSSPSPSASTTPTAATRTPARSPAPTTSPTLAPETPEPSVHPGPPGQPLGFPIDPATRLGLVSGTVGSRSIEWGAGPDALSYTRDSQPSTDPKDANKSGWNCRVHVEYEGQPAVDWYIPAGTPVLATMDGTATLYAITVANGFDYYGLGREPYIGDPDRSRAGLNPFPGPGGGLGVYVEIDSGQFLTVSAHLDLQHTASAVVPIDAFFTGFGPQTDYATRFSSIPDARQGTAVAQWHVTRGGVIGFSGDAGYSEAPHLHYTVQRAGSDTKLCPTAEGGFDDGAWLLK